MTSMGRIIGTGISALAIMLGGTAVAAPGAHAATGDTTCSDGAGGQLCIKAYSNGYDVSFVDRTWSYRHLDFNIVCSDGTYGDNGGFYLGKGQRGSYFFAVGSKKWCLPAVYDFATHKWYTGSRGLLFYN
ncbi:hypothetical protein ACFXKJ_41685 [Kitasatospora indigofera]|uniref:hypothetical protein n=1 Tax=Kitasatospora indigofera TaxID=67307 RepID=UPI00369E7917